MIMCNRIYFKTILCLSMIAIGGLSRVKAQGSKSFAFIPGMAGTNALISVMDLEKITFDETFSGIFDFHPHCRVFVSDNLHAVLRAGLKVKRDRVFDGDFASRLDQFLRIPFEDFKHSLVLSPVPGRDFIKEKHPGVFKSLDTAMCSGLELKIDSSELMRQRIAILLSFTSKMARQLGLDEKDLGTSIEEAKLDWERFLGPELFIGNTEDDVKVEYYPNMNALVIELKNRYPLDYLGY